MLGRHFSQCLWRAINASGGHGLIAHQAALVGHLVCATQHLVLLVWCGRACGHSHSQDHSANPSHCSLHTSMSGSCAHVLTLSTIGDPTQSFRGYSTTVCRRSFYVFRGPPSNRWLWSMISRRLTRTAATAILLSRGYTVFSERLNTRVRQSCLSPRRCPFFRPSGPVSPRSCNG
jgi:hypothetical protein